MGKMTNPTCAKCPHAYNQLNGRYCNLLKRNVEYAKVPLCKANDSK